MYSYMYSCTQSCSLTRILALFLEWMLLCAPWWTFPALVEQLKRTTGMSGSWFESGESTFVPWKRLWLIFECSSYIFDRDRNSQTKVRPKSARWWSYSFLVNFLVVSSRIYVSILMVKWRGWFSSSRLRSADFASSSLKSDPEKKVDSQNYVDFECTRWHAIAGYANGQNPTFSHLSACSQLRKWQWPPSSPFVGGHRQVYQEKQPHFSKELAQGCWNLKNNLSHSLGLFTRESSLCD